MLLPARTRRFLPFVLLLALPAARAAAQRVDEIPLAPGSAPAGIALGSDLNIWFAEEGGNRIGRVNPVGTPLGAPTEYALPNANSAPHGVTGSSNGILFTEGAGRIGRITNDGSLSEFATPGGTPREIAPGPFAQFWWSDPSHDQIRSVDELGRSFYVDTLAAGARPEGVAVGSAGDLWFAETGAGRIGRLYRQPPPPGIPSVGNLQRQEFPLPDPAAGPWGIAFGPDGNVWFTEPTAPGGARVGRLDPATGQVSEFPLPAGAEPRGIVAGLDHAVWFADAARDVIVRLAPDGTMREFPLPTRGSRPTYLAVAPDGNVWFSEPGTNRIGRLAIPPFCHASDTVLCLNGGRFAAAVNYSFTTGPYVGNGQAIPLTSDTGAFWFFSANNLELVVKVVDGRAVNGKFWVFAGALTNGHWQLRVEDTETGRVRLYESAEGQMRSMADTEAF